MILEIYNISTFIEYYNNVPGDLTLIFVNLCTNKTLIIHRFILEPMKNFHTNADISVSLHLSSIDVNSNGYVFIYRAREVESELLYRGLYDVNIETDDIIRIKLLRANQKICVKNDNVGAYASNYLFDNNNFKNTNVMLSMRRVIKSNLVPAKTICLFWGLFQDKYYYDRYLKLIVRDFCPFDVDSDLTHIIMFNKYIGINEYINKYKIDTSKLLLSSGHSFYDLLIAKYKPFLKKVYTMKNIIANNTNVLISPSDGKIIKTNVNKIKIFNIEIDIKNICKKHYYDNMFLIRLTPYDNKNIYNSLDSTIKKISQRRHDIHLGAIYVTTIKFVSIIRNNGKEVKMKYILSLFNFNENVRLTNNKFNILKPSKLLIGQGEHIGNFTSGLSYCILSINKSMNICNDIKNDLECNIKQRDIIAK